MSNKRIVTLDLDRIVAMIFVMFIHSPINADPKDNPAMFFLKGFIACGAVPTFFLLSGYLSAGKINSPTLGMGAYVGGRFRALIIPFLFWNTLVLLLVFAAKNMGLNTFARGSGAYFDVQPTFTSIASALFGIGRSPIVYQFWFLRDLIVVSLFAPVICRCLPHLPLLPWLLFFVPLPLASSLGFFLLGYQLQAIFPDVPNPKLPASALFCFAWILLGWGLIWEWTSLPFLLQQLGSVFFIFHLAAMLAATRVGQRLSLIGPAVFLVYALHEPTQTIIAKASQAYGLPGYGGLVYFLLIPGIVFPACVLAYYALRRFCPFLLPYLTGGR